MRDALVYSTAAYERLAWSFTAALGVTPGRLERKTFPDGERSLRIEDQVEQRDAVLVGGTVSDPDTLEIFDLACTLVAEGARSLTVVIPYFGYSTQERAARPGEAVVAKHRARLLSSIPRAHIGNSALLLDLHSDGIAYYFGEAMQARQVSARPVIAMAIAALRGDIVVCATDAGRAKWVEKLAQELGRPAAFAYKRRLSGSETRVTGLNADVHGKTVALYDDMLRTGGSMLQAAIAYRDAGAARVVAFVTHLLPTGDAIQKIRASGAVERIVCTDSHPAALEQPPGFVEVISIAELLARAALKHGS